MSTLRAMKANIVQGLIRVALSISLCLIYTGRAPVCQVLLWGTFLANAGIAIRAAATYSSVLMQHKSWCFQALLFSKLKFNLLTRDIYSMEKYLVRLV